MAKHRLNKKKLKIVTPMVLSMILLVTFVGYWLHNQYSYEKQNLQKELFQFYYKANSDAEFILFYKDCIKPVLNAGDIREITFIKSDSSNNVKAKREEYARDIMQLINSNKKHYLSLFKSIENDEIIPDSLRGSRYYEIYNVGYKHQINYSKFVDGKDNRNKVFEFMQDLFRNRLNEKFPGLGFKTEEYEKPDNQKWIGSTDKMYLDGMLGFSVYGGANEKMLLLFENYSFYILSRILVQIIFVIVLIGLSVFSLVFAYRNYLSQSKLNMLRSDFISNITHELKIPVATAKAATEAILNYGITDDREKTISYLNMVALEMNRLDSLTTRVLEHSRLENHQHILQKEDTNVIGFIDRIVDSVKMIYPHSVSITFERPAHIITISIDQVYVEGVVRNLIENSKKYGGDDVQIIIRLWQDDLHVFISVEDNGPGIPNEYLNKVFDRFFRVPTGDKHNVKGFGLGLSFASLVMKQHKGTIKAGSRNDNGCEMILQFPK